MQENKMFHSPSRTRAIAEGLGTGVLQALDDWLGAKLLAQQARTQREQRIATANLDNKKLALDERRIAYQELVAQGQVDRLEFEKQQQQRQADEEAWTKQKRTWEEEDRQRQETARHEYEKLMPTLQAARDAFNADPSEANRNRLEEIIEDVRRHGEAGGIPVTWLQNIGKDISTEATQADIEIADKEVYDLYESLATLAPDSDEYRNKKSQLLRAITAADRLRDKPDPTIQLILKSLFSDEEQMKYKNAAENEEALREQFNTTLLDLLQLKSDPNQEPRTLREKEVAFLGIAKDFIDNQEALGKDTTVLKNTLRFFDIGDTGTSDTDIEDEPLSDADVQRNIKNIENRVKQGLMSPEHAENFIDLLRTGAIDTQNEFEKLLTTLAQRQMTEALGKSDQASLGDMLTAYEPGGDNATVIGKLIRSESTDQTRLLTAKQLNGILKGQEFDELSDEQKQQFAQQVISNEKITGDEITRRIITGQGINLGNLAHLYQKYKDVKDKLGIGVYLAEGVLNVVGDTSDPEVAAFSAQLKLFIENMVRIQSGAQINNQEYTRFINMLPKVKNNAEFNDALFEAMDTGFRGLITTFYTGKYGVNWGTVIADKIYDNAHETAAILGEKPSRITQETPQEIATSFMAEWERNSRALTRMYKEMVSTSLKADETKANELRTSLEKQFVEEMGLDRNFVVNELLPAIFGNIGTEETEEADEN